MPEITGVRERRGKARIWVDGEFWAEIDAEVALERGLREGVALGLEELDDKEFARTATREKARRYGPRRVSADLRRSGIDAELAQNVVDEEFAGRSELEEARSAAARRYNRGGSDAEARRVYGFLVRRGYSSDVCAEVAREYRGAPGAGK